MSSQQRRLRGSCLVSHEYFKKSKYIIIIIKNCGSLSQGSGELVTKKNHKFISQSHEVNRRSHMSCENLICDYTFSDFTLG